MKREKNNEREREDLLSTPTCAGDKAINTVAEQERFALQYIHDLLTVSSVQGVLVFMSLLSEIVSMVTSNNTAVLYYMYVYYIFCTSYIQIYSSYFVIFIFSLYQQPLVVFLVLFM